MTDYDDEARSRRIATRYRAATGLMVVVTTFLVGGCNDDNHPPLAPACGPLDAAVVDTDAGPDAGTVVVSCGNPSNVPGIGTVPPGGPSGSNGGQPVMGIGGAPDMGAGGSPGIGAGGSGAFGGTLGAGGFFNGIGGTGVAGTGIGTGLVPSGTGIGGMGL